MSDSHYCHRCGQALGTHDDGECAGVKRAMEFAALRVPILRKPELEIAKRLNDMAVRAVQAKHPFDWQFIAETLEGVQEDVAVEIFKAENVRRAKGNR